MTRPTDYMIDIEALGTKGKFIVVSVGAVKFDLHKGEILDKYYAELNLRQQEKLGRVMDTDCIKWWSQQSPDVLKAISNNNRMRLEDFISSFNAFMREPGKLWAKGVQFDLIAINSLYVDCGQKLPFRYSKFLDCRVYYDLAKRLGITLPERGDVHHNALDDAIYQTKVVLQLFNKIKEGINEKKS